MSLTAAELTALIQYLVGDPQGTTFSPAHYSEAIEFAIKDYAKKTGATYVEVLSAVDSDGFATIPVDNLKVNRVILGNSGTPYFTISVSPTLIQETPGVQVTFTATITRHNGHNANINVLCDNLFETGFSGDVNGNPFTGPLGTYLTTEVVPDSFTINMTGTSGAWSSLIPRFPIRLIAIDGDAVTVVSNEFYVEAQP